MNVSDVEITAGLGGFLVLFALGLVVWFLGRDLSRRLRRMRQAEAARQQADREHDPKSPPAETKRPDPQEPPTRDGPS